MMRWIALAGLAAFLVVLQHYGLERTPEKLQESVYTNIADLPPGDMVPTYVGSLFLGSFRAVAIDVFWLQYEQAKNERRWYTARELMELISALQPHNEEVWSTLAWDSAFNVANGEAQRSEESAWKWIQYGLLKLREGIRRNPKSPYLPFELAFSLRQKTSWKDGALDMALLRRIESDDPLQLQLQNVEVLTQRKSGFELAIQWIEAAKEILARTRTEGDLFYKTQMGLYLRPELLDGFIRECMFFEGIYRWNLAKASADSPDWARAHEWFTRAADHLRGMMEKYVMSSIMDDLLELFDHMHEVLDACREVVRLVPSSSPEGLRRAACRYARVMESVLAALGRVEDGHVLVELSNLKRRLSVEEQAYDENEYNDVPAFATPFNRRPTLYGNFKPGPGDVDVYEVFVQERHDHAEGEPHPFEPRKVTVTAKRDGELPLLVRVYTSADALVASREVTAQETLEFVAEKPGSYFVDVRPLREPEVLPGDTRYAISIKVEE